MYCPKCGMESSSDQRFCRSCGANLKIIGKAVTLSEVVARSDRGPLLKLKEMMESAKVKKTTDDVSRALDQISQDISQSPAEGEHKHPWWLQFKDQRTPERRREDHLTKGAVSFFTGIGLMIFLYYLSASLVLKIPPETLAKLPFELDPVLRIIWLIGLIPTLAGLGRIMAGLMVRLTPPKALEGEAATQPQIKAAGHSEPSLASTFAPEEQPMSVVENTTETLDQKFPVRAKM
jgi:hypothetical protein